MQTIITFLRQFNWVDVFVVILLIRLCYVAVKTGFPVELFKLLGLIFAILLACHNYVGISNFLASNAPSAVLGQRTLNILNLFSFVLLATLGYFVFFILRTTCLSLVRMEAISLLNRWGAIILSIFRWSLLTSLLLMTAAISNNGYLNKGLSDSFVRPVLFKPAPKVYVFLWNNLLSRFMDSEGFNSAVGNLERNLL